MLKEGAVRMRVHHYPQERFDFPAAVGGVLGQQRLDEIHRVWAPAAEGSGQDSVPHRAFYDRFGEMRGLYHDFLRTHILPLFQEDLCVQRTPSFRVGFPGGTAVHEFHVDSDYNHQHGTVNFWLPVTSAFGTNTMWVEGAPGRGDYRPVNLEPGQYLQFDATVLRHGNLRNTTGKTRVSFDFRVIPLREYRPSGLCSVSAGIPLGLGAYYMLLTADGEFAGGEPEAAG